MLKRFNLFFVISSVFSGLLNYYSLKAVLDLTTLLKLPTSNKETCLKEVRLFPQNIKT